ncbi:B12-binding domain-containing radical SAM protein [candidate division CSSED10-310 bacterium]|uniref:B12-binding domain-containing radical SAM protein n=1 Tax=candidate division CSSED10-310 bacterium TaxID=2855610 RepID=A0ABV6YYX7_UNCC1
MKALLVYPPTGVFDRTDRCQTPIDLTGSQAARPPLDLAYMAGGLKLRGVECILRDYPVQGGGWPRLVEDLHQLKPHYFIVSITTFSYHLDMRAVRIAKSLNPETITIAKGAHFQKNHGQMLVEYPELDIAIINESELVPAEITGGDWSRVRGIAFRDPEQGNIIETKTRKFLSNLDSLPRPARELMDLQCYRLPHTNNIYTTVLASRGCPYACIYCLVDNVSGKKVARRSPASLVEEMEVCSSTLGCADFLLKADTFTLDKTWVHEFCDLLIKKGTGFQWFTNSRPDTIDYPLALKMRAAGCWMLAIGVESGNQELLNRIGKKISLNAIRQGIRACQKAQIQTFLYFVIGLPWDNNRTIRQTLDFARELDGDYVEFHPLFPFPGTALYKLGRTQGLFNVSDQKTEEIKPDQFLRTYSLSMKEINRLRLAGLITYYLRFSYLRKAWRRFGLNGFFRLSFFALTRLLGSIYKTAIKPYRP